MDLSTILSIVDTQLPLALFFLVFIVEAGVPIPIPYDILILFAGYKEIPLWWILVSVVAGNILGSSILFFFSRWFGKRLFAKTRFASRFSKTRFRKVEAWFLRYGAMGIILARLIPGFRFAATVISGLVGMSYFKVFLPFLTVGSILWVLVYYGAGKLFQVSYERALSIGGVWPKITVGIFLVFGVFFVGRIVLLHFRNNHERNQGPKRD